MEVNYYNQNNTGRKEQKAKGGRVGLKEVVEKTLITQVMEKLLKPEDILIGRGVIKKEKEKNMMAKRKRKTPMEKSVKKIKGKKGLS